jgi:NADH:ubiquinone oxidoreductase subunit F (NADH-binding)
VPTEVVRPPGGFLTGEESALASWLDGKRATPVFRTDKAVALRVKKSPILLHNAETLAHIALISRNGWRWFRELGTQASPGTALVTVSGAVERPGVHEVALGTPLRRIIEEASPTRGVAAVIAGGYGGAFIASEDLDVPYTSEDLALLGATTGAGVLAVVPLESCGVAETARVARYLARQSAGQCGPCTFGLPAIAGTLEEIWGGDAPSNAMSILRSRLREVNGRGACRHPDGAVRLVASAVRAFGADFSAHASGRSCKWANRPTALTFDRHVA